MKKLFRYILLFHFFSGSLSAEGLEELFTRVYENGIWGVNAVGEGTSGGGSTVEAARDYVSFIRQFLNDRQIRSVVDVGCGDWAFSQYIDWSGISYVGYDIVRLVIERNIQKYAADNIKFIHANFLETSLPAADLFLCKDVFQHLDEGKIQRFLPQLRKYKYCLITDGPTINMYDLLTGFNRVIAFNYLGGGGRV